MANIAPLPHILKTRPYVPGGKLDFEGKVRLMASNENPEGPSPAAIAAMQAAAASAHIYPDPEYWALREAIGAAAGISDISRIVVTSGSDEAIDLLVQAYAGAGDEVLYSEHGFSMYAVSALAHGATPVAAPEHDLTTDVDALIARAGERTRLCFIANPNNPTGTMISTAEITRLREGLPEGCVLVIDAAYIEYLGDDEAAAVRDLVDTLDNTVMTRTFSKMFGLATLRLGWAYLPEAIAATLQRIRGPFNVNGIAAAAGAAAIADREFVGRSRALNETRRATLQDGLKELGLFDRPSFGNFVLAKFASAEAADAANAYLRRQGILVRAIAGYGLPDRLRITVGTEEDNEALLTALKAGQSEGF